MNKCTPETKISKGIECEIISPVAQAPVSMNFMFSEDVGWLLDAESLNISLTTKTLESIIDILNKANDFGSGYFEENF